METQEFNLTKHPEMLIINFETVCAMNTPLKHFYHPKPPYSRRSIPNTFRVIFTQ